MSIHSWRRRTALSLLYLLIAFSASCAPEVDVEKLFVQSNSDDYEERLEARQRLSQLVEKGEVEPFARGLQSRNAETRVQCILHLLVIQSPEAKKPLVEELELSRRFNVFYNPIRLVPVSTPSDSRIMVANILWTKGGDPGAAEILAKSYGKEPDLDTRVATVFALGALHDPAAVPALKRALRDTDLKVVKAALEGLSLLQAPGVSQSLLEGLSDSREEVRANSASALGGFHDSASSEALLQAIHQDPSMKVRLAALGALSNAGGFSAFAPILGFLKDPHSSAEMKEKAATALQEMTGQDFGEDAARWAGWWEHNKSSLKQ
ncbi:MAG: HEAT repeat domain-containing protein [Acidobacteria bacterium]|nr:HEAT repeat domain-containing protein [Acidobacteriota bacterium]